MAKISGWAKRPKNLRDCEYDSSYSIGLDHVLMFADGEGSVLHLHITRAEAVSIRNGLDRMLADDASRNEVAK